MILNNIINLYRFMYIMVILFLFNISFLFAQQPAFPGAEGFGRYVTGGRGGSVKIVNNLNDSGSGSLRAAIQSSGTRTVVFRVSGIINLNSNLTITNGNITIAGQTAPGDGICLKNYPIVIDADNVIIRYIRSRLGDEKDVVADAASGRNQKNIIIDHCSFSWSVDEAASFYDNENFTMQWCIISESLWRSVHEKGDHGYGGIWGGKGASFHHNLLAHHTSRNPRFCGSRYSAQPDLEKIDHRNNVIYNWGGNSCYGAEGGSYNIVNNYYKAGPATGSTDDRIIDPDPDDGSNSQPAGVWGIFYVDDNYVDGYPEITADNWNGGIQGVPAAQIDDIRAYEPFDFPNILNQTPENAFLSVLADAGVVCPLRDSVDARVVYEAETGTATYGGEYGSESGIIDTPSDVGGWPVLSTYDVPTDADDDGMADDWELDNGLNPGDDTDHDDYAVNGYTNLENYINYLATRDDYVRAPAQLSANTISSTEIQLHWKEITPDETGFRIERSVNTPDSFEEVTVVSADDTSYTDFGLESATRYYYRVSAVKNEIQSIASNIADDKTIYADGRALEPENPYPENNAENVEVAAILTWENGNAATSYDVYFGTENPPVNFKGNQTATNYDPGGLLDSTVYYWRVDAVNEQGTTTGNVWRFISEPFHEAVNAYWDFNRGFGSIVLDQSGNGNTAYFRNMGPDNWIDEGLIESAIQFDGVDDYLEVYNDPSINFTIRGFSINFWLKQVQSDSKMPWLSKALYENEQLSAYYELFTDEDGWVNFIVRDDQIGSTLSVENTGFYSSDWVMVTAIRDNNDHTLKLYLNDDFLTSVEDSSYNISNNGPLLIGTNAQMTDFLSAQIDEMQIFNYPLDQTEISDLYESGINTIDDPSMLPRELILSNYPNPFNNTTNISYTIPNTSDVDLSVFNMLGQKVATLVHEKKSPGRYSYKYVATKLSSGIYVFRLQAGQQHLMRKIVLIK
jgi:hypothetical protein